MTKENIAPKNGQAQVDGGVARREFLTRVGATGAAAVGASLGALALWQQQHRVPGFEEEEGMRRPDFPVNADASARRDFDHTVEIFTAGAPPAPATLTKIEALDAIGRGPVSQYASTEKTLPIIGRELGVANIAGGTIARDAGRVRLNNRVIATLNIREAVAAIGIRRGAFHQRRRTAAFVQTDFHTTNARFASRIDSSDVEYPTPHFLQDIQVVPTQGERSR